jgi:4-amino-4-deoxy-L-arabinose transferase-like glycosyltransferase
MSHSARRALIVAFVLGLAVRLIILANTAELAPKIVDEQQYSAIARNIVQGHGFAWGPGQPTSIRPPLYPALLAAIWTVSPGDLQSVRVLQIILSLATAVLTYLLGARVYGRTAGAYAAIVCWLYPSFIFFDFLILTETLFTFLLVGFVLLAVILVESPRTWWAMACGLTLGFAALTRSILWPLPIILCPLFVILIRGPLPRRLALSALVLAGYVVVVGPWAVRNTRLQGVVTVVDTMGGMNLRMGNYEYTPDDRMWDAVALRGDKSWVHGLAAELPGDITEGQKEKWAQRKAIEYMRANPGITLRRSLIKFADFWGLEREFIAGVQNGFYAPPKWMQVAGSVAIVLGYVLVVLAGAAGIWMTSPHDWRAHVLLLLPVLVIMGAHTIVFGHSRYHMPLMPILGVYGGALLSAGMPAWHVPRRALLAGATISVALLLSVWIRQIALVDLPRITSLFQRIG